MRRKAITLPVGARPLTQFTCTVWADEEGKVSFTIGVEGGPERDLDALIPRSFLPGLKMMLKKVDAAELETAIRTMWEHSDAVV